MFSGTHFSSIFWFQGQDFFRILLKFIFTSIEIFHSAISASSAVKINIHLRITYCKISCFAWIIHKFLPRRHEDTKKTLRIIFC